MNIQQLIQLKPSMEFSHKKSNINGSETNFRTQNLNIVFSISFTLTRFYIASRCGYTYIAVSGWYRTFSWLVKFDPSWLVVNGASVTITRTKMVTLVRPNHWRIFRQWYTCIISHTKYVYGFVVLHCVLLISKFVAKWCALVAHIPQDLLGNKRIISKIWRIWVPSLLS